MSAEDTKAREAGDVSQDVPRDTKVEQPEGHSSRRKPGATSQRIDGAESASEQASGASEESPRPGVWVTHDASNNAPFMAGLTCAG
jgi:hypothetical protein